MPSDLSVWAMQTPSKDKRPSLLSQPTPIRHRKSLTASYYVTPVPSTSIAVLPVLGKNPVACKTRIEQLETEFMMALDALSMMPDSDNESEENTAKANSLLQSGAHRNEELQSRYSLTRERYKTKLWNQDFEPVLQRIRVVTAAMSNADPEDCAKSEAVHQLMACGCVVQKEKDILDGLLGDCAHMGAILGDLGFFSGTLSGAGEHYGAWSDDFSYRPHENVDVTPAQNQEHETKTAAGRFNAALLETTSTSDSKTGEGIGFQPYCNHNFTSLQNLHVNPNEDCPPTFPDSKSAAPTISKSLIAYLYAAVTEHIAMAQFRAENASLSAAMDRERKQLGVTFAELRCCNEEDLSLAAGLLIQAVQVQAQVERVRAAAKVDLRVSVKIREEVARRTGVN